MSARAKKPAAAKAIAPVMPTGLKAQNDRVEAARSASDLLYRIITDPSGTDLRALVAKIRAHLMEMAVEYRVEQQRLALSNEQQRRVAPAFALKVLTDDDVQSLAHLFDKQCGLEVNANDDKARIAQLEVVFSILSTDIDVRRLLVDHSKPVARFADKDAAPIEHDDRKAANLADKSALSLFLQHDAKPLMTAYRDGLITTLQYVDRCVEAYLAYTPALSRRTARLYFDQ